MKAAFSANLRQWGGSYGIVIPHRIVKALKLKKGELLTLVLYWNENLEWVAEVSQNDSEE